MPNNCPVDISPLDQSSVTKVPKLASLSYTHQDFWSMKTRLVKFIMEKFPKDFNDFVESSLAIMLIENWAFLADTLSFKIDQIINELFIDTVTEVDNAFRLARLVGFNPVPPIAATCLFSATINQVLAVDMVIPRGVRTEITTQGVSVSYELFAADSNNNPIFDEDIVIPAGSIVNSSIIGIEGRTIDEVFSATGLPGQIFALEEGPVIFDSIKVEVDGVRWDHVDSFTDSQPRREFRIEYDSSYRAFVITGNNRAGFIPPEGSTVKITYRVGGGTIGNVITGYIDFQRGFDVVGLDVSVPVNFRNYTKAANGYDGDGIEEIRNKLPAYLKTQNRAVTGEDYKTLADQFATPYSGQIGKATAVLRNHGCAGNVIDLFVLAKDGNVNLQEVSSDLKVALMEEIENKKMLTDFVCLRDGVIVLVDTHIDVTLDKSLRKLKEEIDVKIRRRIDNFFALPNWDYGDILRDTNLIKELSDIKEVNSYDVTFITNDPNNQGNVVTTKYYEIIRPDTISINYVFV